MKNKRKNNLMREKDLNSLGINMFHMEHKNYKLEIVSILAKDKDHIRQLARRLKTNHTTISRKVNELMDENIVDFDMEGKNKTYHLKKNAETRTYLLMAENYRLLRFLKKYPSLKDVTNKIQMDSQIKLALFFGSYVKGHPSKNSDVDIFIETNSSKIKKDYLKLDSRLSIKIGKLGNDELGKEIGKNHIIIKGGDYYYEGFLK